MNTLTSKCLAEVATAPGNTPVSASDTLSPSIDDAVDGIKTKFTQKAAFKVMVEEQYDDNIFSAPEDEKKGDYITRLRPAITYAMSRNFMGHRSNTSLDARLNMDFYKDHPDLNKNSFLPKLYASFDLSRRLDLFLKISRDQQDMGNLDPAVTGEDRQKKKNYWEMTAGGALRLGPKENIFEIAYDHSEMVYDGSYKADNRMTENISLTAYFGDETARRGFLEYQPRIETYPKNDSRNRVSHHFWGGIQGKFSPKISGSAKCGYGLIVPREGSRYGSFIAEASLKYRLSKALSFTFILSRDLGNDTPGSASSNVENEASYEPSAPEDDSAFATNDLKYTDEARVNITYRPAALKDFSLNGSAYWRNRDYEGGALDDVTYGLSFTPHYSLNKWVSIGAGYDYTRRLSSKNLNGYIDNKFTVNLTLEF